MCWLSNRIHHEISLSRLRITFSFALSLRMWFSSNSDGSSGLPGLSRRSELLKWGQESIARWPGGCCALLTPDPISKAKVFPAERIIPHQKTPPHGAIHHMHNRNLICRKHLHPSQPCHTQPPFPDPTKPNQAIPTLNPALILPTQAILASIKLCPRCSSQYEAVSPLLPYVVSVRTLAKPHSECKPEYWHVGWDQRLTSRAGPPCLSCTHGGPSLASFAGHTLQGLNLSLKKNSAKKNFMKTLARKCKNKAFPSTQCEVRPGKTTCFGISEKILTAARLTAKKKRLDSYSHFASRSWPSTLCFCESRRCSTIRFCSPSSQAPKLPSRSMRLLPVSGAALVHCRCRILGLNSSPILDAQSWHALWVAGSRRVSNSMQKCGRSRASYRVLPSR